MKTGLTDLLLISRSGQEANRTTTAKSVSKSRLADNGTISTVPLSTTVLSVDRAMAIPLLL